MPPYLVPQPIQWQRGRQSLWSEQGSRASTSDNKSWDVWGQLDSSRCSQHIPTTMVGTLWFQVPPPVWESQDSPTSCVVRDILLTPRGAMTIENIQTNRLWRSGVGKRMTITQISTSHLLWRLLVYSLQPGNGFHILNVYVNTYIIVLILFLLKYHLVLVYRPWTQANYKTNLSFLVCSLTRFLKESYKQSLESNRRCWVAAGHCYLSR